jgi:hypothetical protein
MTQAERTGMSEPMTVGEKVDRDGPCELLVRIADIALALGRIPVGEWDYTFASDRRWRVLLNGGQTDTWTPEPGLSVPRFHAMVFCNGLPLALVDAAGGTVAQGQEDPAIAAVEAELAHLRTLRNGGGR